ncbi:hypothetical protein [uncultured Helicobacter sp.]|nr:hypothetical protein [uncultured Helicobacter sp.]
MRKLKELGGNAARACYAEGWSGLGRAWLGGLWRVDYVKSACYGCY